MAASGDPAPSRLGCSSTPRSCTGRSKACHPTGSSAGGNLGASSPDFARATVTTTARPGVPSLQSGVATRATQKPGPTASELASSRAPATLGSRSGPPTRPSGV